MDKTVDDVIKEAATEDAITVDDGKDKDLEALLEENNTHHGDHDIQIEQTSKEIHFYRLEDSPPIAVSLLTAFQVRTMVFTLNLSYYVIRLVLLVHFGPLQVNSHSQS